MTLDDEIRQIATIYREDLLANLDRARHDAARASKDSNEAQQRIATYRHLLALADDGSSAESAKGMTLHAAMELVLSRDHYGMLRAKDLAAEINAGGLYRMKDGRAVEPQQIHARVGRYEHLFEREGTFIKLREDAQGV